MALWRGSFIRPTDSAMCTSICEAKFYEHSYGFRPNRCQEHAIVLVYKNIQVSHCYFVVDIDIKGFFDNVNHGKQLNQM